MSRGMKIGLTLGMHRSRGRRRRRLPDPRRRKRRHGGPPREGGTPGSGERGDGERQHRGEDIGGHQRGHHRPHHQDRGPRGRRVRKGQFLIQIDPAQYQAAVDRAQGVVSSTQATVLQTGRTVIRPSAPGAGHRSSPNSVPNLITQESAEQAQTAYEVAQANHRVDAGATRSVAREPAGSPRQPRRRG